ncbi:hypothetical protein [uncultured Clostridium sp.]|nr:hypothetical protein [uncultured Clostridium sp.]
MTVPEKEDGLEKEDGPENGDETGEVSSYKMYRMEKLSWTM